MEIFSPRHRRYNDEQPARRTLMSTMPMVRSSGMALVAMLLAVILAVLVCG